VYVFVQAAAATAAAAVVVLSLCLHPDASLRLLSVHIQHVITDEDVIQSLLPTTIIDMDRWQVRQTHPYHVHTVLRREFMNLAVKRLVSSDADKRGLWSSR
jgi:hypothetical protein